MNNYCSSCGMALAGEEGKDFRGNFCIYCSDENGKLYPKELVQKGIAEWLRSISPESGSADFMKRAEYYMKAMPSWAD
ncbi:MAG: hypothetical protein JW864_18900 [Spirochaetes bacterium]|nr:hypothetical protein [Spirochaetota bacterium]